MATAKKKTDAATRSVVKTPASQRSAYGGAVWTLASIAEAIVPWGNDPAARDVQLRSFWPTENFLSSAIYAVQSRNACFSWKVQGEDEQLVAMYQDIVLNANNGVGGWQDFVFRAWEDWLTQDNGFFVEIVRAEDKPDSPCIGINNLDAARCIRTGVRDWPVLYYDRDNALHRLAPWQVYFRSDQPSNVETMNGVGHCAVTRVLREAEKERDIQVRERERMSAADPKSLYLIGNVATKLLEAALTTHKQMQLEKGFVRYVKSAVMGVIDPTAPPTVQKIDFAANPEGYDIDKDLRWYITALALAIGCDYQDLAPLASGSLGSSQQSQILHLKSQGKGPALFMKTISHMMNFGGILPKGLVEWTWDEQDIQADTEEANLELVEANTYNVLVGAKVFTPGGVRQMMLDDGRITQEQFNLMEKQAQEEAAQAQRQQSFEQQMRQTEVTARAQQFGGGAGAGQTLRDDAPTEGKAIGEKGGQGSGNFAHAGRPGEIGGSAPGAGYSSERSERAKASHKPATREVQAKGDANQKHLANKLDGVETADNAPFDVIVGDRDAVEVKTIVRGKNDKITMHPESRLRKERAARANRYRSHTVVFDDRDGSIYYKKGVGSFRLKNMEKVSIDELEGKFR